MSRPRNNQTAALLMGLMALGATRPAMHVGHKPKAIGRTVRTEEEVRARMEKAEAKREKRRAKRIAALRTSHD